MAERGEYITHVKSALVAVIVGSVVGLVGLVAHAGVVAAFVLAILVSGVSLIILEMVERGRQRTGPSKDLGVDDKTTADGPPMKEFITIEDGGEEILKIPAPGSFAPLGVTFITGASSRRLITTECLPKRIDFTSPFTRTVKEDDLPAVMPGWVGRAPVITVKEFRHDGFVIEEHRPSTRIDADIYCV